MGASNSCCKSKDTDQFEATEAQRKGVGGDYGGSEVVKGGSATVAPAAARAGDKSGEFSIRIDHSCGTRLGIDVDHQDGSTLLIDAVTGGLVEEWNNANPAKAVKAGHRVIEINGVRGDVLQLVDECKKNKVLDMVVKTS